jgi:uncharacterized protein
MRHVSIITLGVADVAASSAFYEALGWTRSSASQDEIAFLTSGALTLALFGLEDLAADAGTPSAPLPPFRGLALATNLPSEQAVDELVAEAVQLGATVVHAPAATDWGGYSGYLADLDGHLWEVALNPFFPLDEEGRVTLPGPA